MAKPPSGYERIRCHLEEQARVQAETQKVNSVLTNRVTELQDQLLAERESTQERINLERAERENLEERLKEERAERAERDRLLEEERRSRLEFERNMMLKFTQLSQQMGTKQTQANQTSKKTTGKENSNPNPQNTILKTVSTTGAVGTSHTIISPNTLIQAATKNNRHFRAMTLSRGLIKSTRSNTQIHLLLQLSCQMNRYTLKMDTGWRRRMMLATIIRCRDSGNGDP